MFRAVFSHPHMRLDQNV